MRFTSACLLACLSLLSVGSYSQVERCFSAGYLEQLSQDDPSLADLQETIRERATTQSYGRLTEDEVYYIPVVVHVVYSNTSENISDDQIYSQIEVLNNDFRLLNDDADKIPADFADNAGDALIEFRLAALDPDGNPTTGITRTETSITQWDINAPITADNNSEKVKADSTGGHDPWDATCYLNIWVCDLGALILGYAAPPGTSLTKDGIVVGYKWFGSGGSAVPPYNRGRTATHEIGHWLGLKHVWGDDGNSCAGSDGVADTPNQAGPTYGCLSYPATDACSPNPPGIMFMNYMDYSDDTCMYMFTQGQANIMRSVLEDERASVVACALVVTNDSLPPGDEPVFIYPNPTTGFAWLPIDRLDSTTIEVGVYNVLGQQVIQLTHDSRLPVGLDLNDLPNGAYFVMASDGLKTVNGKVVLLR